MSACSTTAAHFSYSAALLAKVYIIHICCSAAISIVGDNYQCQITRFLYYQIPNGGWSISVVVNFDGVAPASNF